MSNYLNNGQNMHYKNLLSALGIIILRLVQLTINANLCWYNSQICNYIMVLAVWAFLFLFCFVFVCWFCQLISSITQIYILTRVLCVHFKGVSKNSIHIRNCNEQNKTTTIRLSTWQKQGLYILPQKNTECFGNL